MNSLRALYTACLIFFCMNPVKIQSTIHCSEETERHFKINRKDITNLSSSDKTCFSRIAALKKKNIVAIGETIHGTETMSETAFQLIRYQIEQNNCRLVLLEINLEEMLSFNRFVQGDESFNIDSLLNSFDMGLFSVKQLKEFCLWLKEYNKDLEEKVWLLGADYCVFCIGCIPLCEFLYTINLTQNSNIIKQLYEKIYGAILYCDFTDVLNLFSESFTLLEDAIGEKEAAIIKHCITTFDNMLKSTDKDVLKAHAARDYVMFVNTEYLLNLLTPPKACIYMHWLHTNYLVGGGPVFDLKPFGSYMKEKYKNNLFCISLRSESGNYLIFERDSTKTSFFMTFRKMEEPPTKSYEYYLSQTGEDYFYVPTSVFPKGSLPARWSGNKKYDSEFSDFSTNCDDGIIFIRTCESLDHPIGEVIPPYSDKTFTLLKKHAEILRNLQQ